MSYGRQKSLVGRAWALEKAKRAEAQAAKPDMVLSEEACFFCGESSNRSHPGGVITRRWKCYPCGRWQPDARPGSAKVLTEEEALAQRDPFTRRIAEAVDQPALLESELAL